MVDTAIFSIFHRAPPPPAPEPVGPVAAPPAAPAIDPAPEMQEPEPAALPPKPSEAAHEPVAAEPAPAEATPPESAPVDVAPAEFQHADPPPAEPTEPEAAPVEHIPVDALSAATVPEQIEVVTDHPEIPALVAEPAHAELPPTRPSAPPAEPEAAPHPNPIVEPAFGEAEASLPTAEAAPEPEPEHAPALELEPEHHSEPALAEGYPLAADEQAYEDDAAVEFVPQLEAAHKSEPSEHEPEPAGDAKPVIAWAPEAEPEFLVDPLLEEPSEEQLVPEIGYADYGVEAEPERPFGAANEPPQPPTIALWADEITTPQEGAARSQVGLAWLGPTELTGVPVDADQLGLANPIVITLHARLSDFSAVELDASQSGIYRPQTFRAAPWSGFAYDQALDGRTGFAAGTRILTARGEMEVEKLLPGDTALALRAPALLPIAWIGKSVATAAPVWIEAGALGPNLPRRALCLASDQPVYVEPVPVPAGRLVNGTTIRVVETEDVDLFHVDVGKSEILFAEGVPLSSSDRARLQRA